MPLQGDLKYTYIGIWRHLGVINYLPKEEIMYRLLILDSRVKRCGSKAVIGYIYNSTYLSIH